MKQEKRETLNIVGLAVRTLNAPERASIDIPTLWGKFMASELNTKLPTKLSDDIYCVYCEYEGDHTEPYTTLIGYSVSAETEIPEGLKSIVIPASNYAVFGAEGDLTGEAVFNAWNTIWKSDLNRTYHADFEVYGKEAMNPKDGKINIFVGIS